jgi:hypothetical protein
MEQKKKKRERSREVSEWNKKVYQNKERKKRDWNGIKKKRDPKQSQ